MKNIKIEFIKWLFLGVLKWMAIAMWIILFLVLHAKYPDQTFKYFWVPVIVIILLFVIVMITIENWNKYKIKKGWERDTSYEG